MSGEPDLHLFPLRQALPVTVCNFSCTKLLQPAWFCSSVDVAYDQLDNVRAGSMRRDWCGSSCGDVHNHSFMSFMFWGGECGSGGSHTQKAYLGAIQESKML